MSENGKFSRVVAVGLGVIGLGVAAVVVVIKLSFPGSGPRIAPSARNMRAAEDVRVVEVAPVQDVLVAPQPSGSSTPTRALVPTPVNNSVVAKAVDGDEYTAELARTVGLTDVEKDRVHSFLQMISRAQEQTARATDSAHRQDLERRLQYQTLNGIRIRVASDKREKVTDALQKGVPRLAFADSGLH